jgi:hypothetical protein
VACECPGHPLWRREPGPPPCPSAPVAAASSCRARSAVSRAHAAAAWSTRVPIAPGAARRTQGRRARCRVARGASRARRPVLETAAQHEWRSAAAVLACEALGITTRETDTPAPYRDPVSYKVRSAARDRCIIANRGCAHPGRRGPRCESLGSMGSRMADLEYGLEERIPARRLNANLWPLRSDVTWGSGGPHSGYRHLADKDEAGGSSPPRPTSGSNQRKRWSSYPEPGWGGAWRIKNAYLVTVPGHRPDGLSPHRQRRGCMDGSAEGPGRGSLQCAEA